MMLYLSSCVTLTHLVECWENVVGELNLCNGRDTVGGKANTERNNALLTKRRVEHALVTLSSAKEDREEQNVDV